MEQERMELPDNFINEIKSLLKDEYIEFLKSYEKKYNCGLRVNTLKINPSEFMKRTPFEIKPVPWLGNGFYYDEKDQPAKHPYYYAGLYYIQEPSAMTPASLLPVVPGDRVLDLCAAPGGKSTELAAKLQGNGVLVANDISNSRAKALLKNIELSGVRNAIVSSEAPDTLFKVFEGYFDKILVDAPCSGEGMFRKNPSMIQNWEQCGPAYYHELQKEILTLAVKMLRPGGFLLYSTCTFSVLENEGTVKNILETFSDIHVVPATQKLSEYQFSSGVLDLAGGYPELLNAVRLWPHKIKGEGHFAALLRKDEVNNGNIASDISFCQQKKLEISVEAREFLEKIDLPMPEERLLVIEGRIYLLPCLIPKLSGLRLLRSGLLLGEMKKKRFEPSQALANALKQTDYDNIYNMEVGHPDVIRYLKCESIQVPNTCLDGWLLICVDGFPLGWGKKAKNSFKNKYQAGWRWL